MRVFYILSAAFVLSSAQNAQAQAKRQANTGEITPNNFSGTDTERIQAAIRAAKGTTNRVVIQRNNASQTNVWKIDNAILLPSDMTIVLDNCLLQLTDKSRDNMFRSDNVGIGTKRRTWNRNISIIGIGEATLKGADNPRSTGDGARKLVLTPQNGRVSYGSDAGKPDQKQTGDWRNIMILIAYVDGFNLQNVSIKNSHAWAVSFERTLHANISNIKFDLPEEQLVNGNTIQVHNRDGIDLRQGCKYFRISNISGNTEDDFIALSSLGTKDPDTYAIGDVNSTMVTAPGWKGVEDDIEHIVITDITCQTNTRAVAIRATDSAGIHDVYINGVIARTMKNNMLVGGQGYGKPSIQGRINNIHAINIVSDGSALVLIEALITDCVFMNGIFTGTGPEAISYNTEKAKLNTVKEVNIVKTR